MTVLKTGMAGLELIRQNEGIRLNAYRDVVGVWTIGYGDTGPDVHEGMRITQAQADQMLADRLAREFEPGVWAAIGDAPTTQSQFDAMVSLAYNIGVGVFGRSSVARMHRAGNYASAAAAFAWWNIAGGRVFPGLARRRAEEAALYLAAAPSAAIDGSLPQLVEFERAARALQEELRNQGFYRGAIDGDFGPVSRAALAAWRAAHPTGS